MKMTLGAFSRTGLEAYAEGEFSATLGDALDYYVAQLAVDRAALEYPRFRRGRTRGGELFDVSVQTRAATRQALDREARRQRVSLECLLEHALLVYLADRESRRP